VHAHVDPVGKLLDIQEQVNDVLQTSVSEAAIDLANRVLTIILGDRW
jgi:hypothetical protein